MILQSRPIDILRVTYSASAQDNIDGSVNVSFPSSDSYFYRETTVTCSATDNAGNETTAEFFVIIAQIYEFYGGIKHDIYSDRNGATYRGLATITIGATNSSGVLGAVVSGHVVNSDISNILRHHTIQRHDSNFKHIFSTETGLMSVSGKADAAFVPITKTTISILNDTIQKHNGETFAVSQGTLSEVSINSTISIYGRYSNGDGILKYKNATVYTNSYSTTKIITNVGIGTYPRQSGDSGAPIIYHDTDTSKLIGVHRGVACTFHLESISEGLDRTTLESDC